MHTFLLLGRKQPDPACGSTNLANLADLTNLSLEPGVIFRTIERTGDTRRATIYWRMRSSTNVEFSELIKFNVNLVLRTSFALGLDFLCL